MSSPGHLPELEALRSQVADLSSAGRAGPFGATSARAI